MLEDKEILSECETFYKDLYTSKAGEEAFPFPFPPNPEENTLTAEERAFCEGLINEEERLKALNSMPSKKNAWNRWIAMRILQSCLE